MNLVIDVGNTQYKICIFDGEEMVFNQYADGLSKPYIDGLFNEFTLTQGIFSDTRGEQENYLKSVLPLNFPIIELTHNTPLPIKLDYETPETLGKDRIAGAAGAHSLFPNKGVLIIDIGTAITIDYITNKGVFIGGVISPGPETRFNALHHFTGKLPLEKAVDETKLYGKRTSTAIQYGVQNGVLYELNGYIQDYTKQFGPIEVIITGGYSYLFDKKIKYPIFAKPYLIPQGLNRILNYNE